MRRGLIAWSKTELPEAALAGRVARTQAAMADAGLAALILYSNNTRPAAASWLCGFVPYWSEGIMVLPRVGEPYLVVALTKRVQTWIAATSRVAKVVSTGRFGLEAGKEILAAGGGTVGIADLDGFPSGIAAELRGTGLGLVDATPLFADLRSKADPAELALAARAAAIARVALAQASARHDESGMMIAAVEGEARARGAEECYVAAATDLAHDTRLKRHEGSSPLGRSYAVRATVAYKGSWVRATRTVFRATGGSAHIRQGAERFAAAVATLPHSSGFAGVRSWLVEGCRVAQPLEALAGSAVAEPRVLPPGGLVSVQACLDVDGEPIVLGAPALLGARGEPAALLLSPLYDEGG
ncbi:MAG TPA: aminopeptidase P family N-terminal domain-containing protein [Stellaceae bacterium]|nr:aminopeptidase P family N-terminal domain-containing protein [Stellaceae bacterium]